MDCSTYMSPFAIAPICVKMAAPEPLLRSEGVCQQLVIITYHQDILATQSNLTPCETDCRVPTVRVQLVHSIKLPPKPDQTVVAEVSWSSEFPNGPLLQV